METLAVCIMIWCSLQSLFNKADVITVHEKRDNNDDDDG